MVKIVFWCQICVIYRQNTASDVSISKIDASIDLSLRLAGIISDHQTDVNHLKSFVSWFTSVNKYSVDFVEDSDAE